jgi:Holliday junction DNA helicase RuvA
MIGWLQGRLLAVRPGRLLLGVGGVGYEVGVSLPTYAELERRGLGEAVELYVYTHVREDQIALFGFLTERERALFELLLGVSGIGPRLALTILSGVQAEELVAALARGDVRQLVAIPGVGRKIAERLVLELRERVGSWVAAAAPEPGSKPAVDRDVLDALVHLGYKPAQAERAVAEVRRDLPTAGFAELLRRALAQLAPKGNPTPRT